MAAEQVLEISGLTRRFRGGGGIQDISLSLQAGERLALLGHNGAGKSTLMKAILGLIATDQGHARIQGAAPGSTQARAATAYLPEAVAFHPALTGREQLKMFTRLAAADEMQVDQLLERVSLTKAADRRIGTYSKGMRQRLGMAQVFLGRPALALLDEPTSGLDPMARHDLYALVDDLTDQGTAVIMASHALTEIEARTDRIVILRQGTLVADAPLDELAARAAMPIRFRLHADADASALFDRFGGQRVNGSRVEFACDPADKMARLAEITAMGTSVRDVEIIPPSLEDLYRHYSGQPVGGAA